MARDETIHLDMDDKEELSKFSLGDGVTVTVKGTIKSLSSPQKFDDEKETFPGSMGIDVKERKIEGKNVFSDMDRDVDRSED